MMIRFFLIFCTFTFSASASQLNISSSLLNSELKKNYSFVERSLNQSNLKIESSKGTIFFDSTGITVNVLTPFEENYRIEGGNLEIHDVFLDQKKIIDVNAANNFFLNILIDGIDENARTYSVHMIDNSTIEVVSTNGSDLISFQFINNQLNLIRYKDSIGVEHGIELTPL